MIMPFRYAAATTPIAAVTRRTARATCAKCAALALGISRAIVVEAVERRVR